MLSRNDKCECNEGSNGVDAYKDSGTRREFETGAVRDMAEGKGRFDLLPFDAIQELAIVYDNGCGKYGARNWEKGIPVSAYLDSAARHLLKAISGETDEPHLPMAMWNISCAIQTTKWVYNGRLPSSLAYDKPIRLGNEQCDPHKLAIVSKKHLADATSGN